jgi:hypothetical protein
MFVVITLGGGGIITKTNLIFDWLVLRPPPPREREREKEREREREREMEYENVGLPTYE